MARYTIFGRGFPVGQFLIPSGTLIDDVAGTDQWSTMIRERRLPPPVEAQPHDAGAYAQMVQLYGSHRVAPVREPPSDQATEEAEVNNKQTRKTKSK